jgi:hypothetical protein
MSGVLNPYTILGAVLFWLASLAGVGYWQHEAGVDAQKVADQGEFDKVNEERREQTAQSNKLYRVKQDEVIAALAERDNFKNELEAERGQHRLETDALRNRYAREQLRFRAFQDAGPGAGGGGAASAQGNTPALMSPPSYSFQTRLQAIFDSSLSTPTASKTNTPPATGGPTATQR